MKKFFVSIIVLFISFYNIVLAQDIVLPSAVGLVKSIRYEDVQQVLKEDQTVKQSVTVEVLNGNFKGTERIIDNMITGNPAYDIPLSKGDKVILHLEPTSQTIVSADDVDFFIADIERKNQILIFAGIFIVLLILIGRKKGVTSVISIVATVFLIFLMLMPMILNGVNPIISSIITGILSTIITIYLVGGFNSKSTSAIIGTSSSLVVAGIMSMFAIVGAHLTGFAGEENMFLYSNRPDLNFGGILSASMIIASLGALMDTSVSIASTINEIHETDSNLNVRQLFKSGMNVGRDIIGTMSNTLILVYLGSSLPLVLLSNNIDLSKFFNLNQVATEILSALVGSIGILASVPITAIIASILIKNSSKKDNFEMKKFDIQ